MKLPHIFTITTSVGVLLLLTGGAIAELDMTLIDTIMYPDSLRIIAVTSAGDFNADGYDDMAVAVEQQVNDHNHTVYMYYGGPGFDTEPDLVFTNNYEHSAYGLTICGIGDFNGDGVDDFSVSNPYYDGSTGWTGRL